MHILLWLYIYIYIYIYTHTLTDRNVLRICKSVIIYIINREREKDRYSVIILRFMRTYLYTPICMVIYINVHDIYIYIHIDTYI